MEGGGQEKEERGGVGAMSATEGITDLLSDMQSHNRTLLSL